jgi:hypothetical protein
MSILGGFGNNNEHDLASIYPDGRERAARRELREAEAAYRAAEDRLIKARRAYEDADREWRNFYYPQQDQR